MSSDTAMTPAAISPESRSVLYTALRSELR